MSSRPYRKLNRKWTKEDRKEYLRQRHRERRDLVAALKDVPCADCGGIFPSVVMQFDHLGDDKVAAVGQLLDGSLDKLLEEIAKCEVVCANCHVLRTAKRAGWYE